MEEVVPVGGSNGCMKKNAHNTLERQLIDVVYFSVDSRIKI